MKGNLDPIQLSRSLVTLSRPQDFLYAGLLAGLTSQLSHGNWSRTLFVVGLLLGLYTLAVTYNNLRDFKIDLVNNRLDNPLVARRINNTHLQIYGVVVASLVVIGLISFGSARLMALSLIYILLLIIYSHPVINFQSRGVLAFVPLVICYGCIPVLMGIDTYSPTTYEWTLTLLQLPLLLPMLLAKDYKDIKGDTKYGKKTFLVRHGPKVTLRFSVTIAVILLIYLTLIVVYYNHSLLLIPLGLIYVLVIFYIHRKQSQVHHEFKRLGFAAVLAIITILLSNDKVL